MLGASSKPHPRGLGDLVVVIVEDYDLVLSLIRDTLKPYFEYTYAFASVFATKAWLAQNDVDVLVCDLRLKDGNGLEVISYAMLRNPDVAVVICSGDSSGVSVMTGSGCAIRLDKPFTSAALLQSVYRAGDAILAIQQAKISLPEGVLQ